VEYGDDLDSIDVGSVIYAVREAAQHRFPYVRQADSVHQWIGCHTVKYRLNLGRKSRSKARSLRVLPIECFIELGFGFGP
jgi:hypothetical protein